MPSTRFLFWNINRKPLAPVIAELAASNRTDVIVLAESRLDQRTMLKALNSTHGLGFHFPTSKSKGLSIYTRFSRKFLTPTYESDRLSIMRLALPGRLEIILATVHMPSKLHWSDESQALECAELARNIATVEDKVGHRRTVLVGDFNMNPFEVGLVGAAGLHAVMSRRVASRAVRTVQGREYRFFYNPMWAHLSDVNSDTAGSYYYDRAEHVNYFWNTFDQVLLRPELAAHFDRRELKILTIAGERSLVGPDGRPDAVEWSDHLPVIFELTF